MEEETWKVVEGWNNKYKVSNTGRVWNTITDVEVSQVVTGVPQYKYVNLHLKGQKSKLVRVHRLVAIAFVKGRDEKYDVVDHIDRDKFNNHYTNLRWTDHSGNQKNTDSSIYICGEHIKEFVKRYDSPAAAYSYLYSYISNGMSEQEALNKYQEHIDYGFKRVTVEWDGHDVYLVDLCNQYSKDYETVKVKLGKGWPVWNSLTGIAPDWHFSFQVSDGVVGYWYPSKEAFRSEHGTSVDVLTRLLDMGYSRSQILNYDGLDHFRQTILGVTGTMQELCDYFNMSLCSVSSRMDKGMTLEEALTIKPKKVKKFKINGVSNTPKAWCESFGINPRRFTNYKSKSGKSILECLEYFGVDTSDMTITFGD